MIFCSRCARIRLGSRGGQPSTRMQRSNPSDRRWPSAGSSTSGAIEPATNVAGTGGSVRARVPAVAEQRLWAPWRMRYVQGERGEARLHLLPGGGARRRRGRGYVLERGERGFTMLNAFPYNSGHLMVSPVTATRPRWPISATANRSHSCACCSVRSVRSGRRTGPTAPTSASTRARSRAPGSPITCMCTSFRAGRPTATSWR